MSNDSKAPITDDELGHADWSHIQETINMLYLAVCQIEATMADSNKAVDTLTGSFALLANHTNAVSAQINQLSKIEQLDAFKQDLTATATEMNSNISSSIEAFQFYDRVCQRLDHVARSLEKVTELMQTENSIHDPAAWRQVQLGIKSSYTMEAERIMFEFIMRGGKVKDALDIYRHHFESTEIKTPRDDEIELF
ncbi:hypothetical protein [Teredinibacter waterburyi]|jgi:hypothetical protein|uniref:hypothetical protein n=1 Tax=Teredinibacter waterburyi TaxID=1500538 RepID=UPI001FEB2337|nr:hypothetical protein [Teredinibacter waterburyi]